MNILVVDDDATTRKLFSQLLSKDGHRTTTADSGFEALDKVGDLSFDLALVDLKMPGIDGIQVLKKIKSLKPRIQVVIVTGYGTVETAVEALKIGAFDYIEKPFKIKKLREIIDDIVVSNNIDPEKLSEIEKTIEPIFDLDGCYDLFKSSLENNNGLCITNKDKRTLKEKYGLSNVPIIKLNKGLITLDPENKSLDKVRNSILEFNRENESSMILIDGFQFFAKYFSWNELKIFVQEISNEMSRNKSKLILYVDSTDLQPSDIEDLRQLVCDVTISIGLNISSSSLEIDILQYLSKHDGSTFNKIFKGLNINQSSKLSFHLQKLQKEGVIAKSDRSYVLAPKGEIILRTLNYFNDLADDSYEAPISILYNKQ